MSKEIVDAAMINGRNGRVYCIGSFADRVNFLAQQYRALNTVWALHQEQKFEAGDTVAVIGAGLAGITAAAAFMAFGATVHLYEGGRRALHRQRETSHRRVHPSISVWPEEDLAYTTELPFFDWYSGLCNDIAEILAGDLDKMFEGAEHRFFGRCTATDIHEIGTELIRIVCKEPIRTNPPTTEPLAYRIALITVGFGEERTKKEFKTESYWREDNLEACRDGDDASAFIVSGCGDGGLIDALRIVHVDFAKGQLAFDVAAALSGTTLADEIMASEQRARTSGKSNHLESTYVEAAKRIGSDPAYRTIDELLMRSLNGFDGIVYLGDVELSDPFSPRSAPIHKLLVAHADHCAGKIKFRKGEVTETGVDPKAVKFAGFEFSPSPQTRVVIRHGAKPDFKRLLSDDEIEALKAKQSGRSDFHGEPSWGDSYQYPVPEGFETRDLTSSRFVHSRLGLARRAMRRFSEDIGVTVEGSEFRVEGFPADFPRQPPATLFGIRANYALIREGETL